MDTGRTDAWPRSISSASGDVRSEARAAFWTDSTREAVKRPMPKLRVDFQEGFAGQDVVLRAAGRERFRGPLKTRMQTGLAALVELTEPAARVALEIDVSGSSPLQFDVQLDRDTYVCISRDARGGLTHEMVFDPPGYL